MKNILLLLLCLWGSLCSFAQTTYTTNSLVPLEDQPKVIEKETINNGQVIPFKLLGGLILIDIKINGLASSCILDTGAPAIIINKEEDLINTTNDFGVGVTGRTKMKNRMVRSFEMGNLKRENIKAVEIDISHIEEMKSHVIHGIIGVNAYKRQEVLIDYNKGEIQLLPRKQKKKIGGKRKIATVPFLMEHQLPVIKIKVGKKIFNFGVDTGAEVNVIDSRCIKELKKCKIKMGGEQLMTSVCQTKNLVKTVTLEQFKIKKKSFNNCDFSLMDLSQFSGSHGIELDGILGFPFLKENLISFDFRRSQLNFWEENKIKVEDIELGDLAERVIMGEK
ncbi:MAG: hypothetical protein ACI8X3_003466 [Saprospiraceae bacterium]|jgi:hypothetical protein